MNKISTSLKNTKEDIIKNKKLLSIFFISFYIISILVSYGYLTSFNNVKHVNTPCVENVCVENPQNTQNNIIYFYSITLAFIIVPLLFLFVNFISHILSNYDKLDRLLYLFTKNEIFLK